MRKLALLIKSNWYKTLLLFKQRKNYFLSLYSDIISFNVWFTQMLYISHTCLSIFMFIQLDRVNKQKQCVWSFRLSLSFSLCRFAHLNWTSHRVRQARVHVECEKNTRESSQRTSVKAERDREKPKRAQKRGQKQRTNITEALNICAQEDLSI